MYGVDSLPYLAILTGIICLIVFLLKWERYVLLVPSSVMEGFTVGVAFIIALNQVRTISLSLSGVCVCVRARARQEPSHNLQRRSPLTCCCCCCMSHRSTLRSVSDKYHGTKSLYTTSWNHSATQPTQVHALIHP